MAQRPHTSSPKQKGRRSDEGDDVFVAAVYEASTWAQRNTQTLILLGVVLAVIIGGVIYYVGYREDVTQQAVVQLEQIQQGMAMGDPETAKAELAQYVDRFAGTPYAAEARLLLGQLYLESDQTPQAIEVLEGSDISIREPIGAQLAVLRAKAYEAAGQLQAAEETFLQVADRAELGFQRTEALEAAARVRLQQDNPEGAAELYRQILDGLDEGDPQRGRYEMLLAEMRARVDG